MKKTSKKVKKAKKPPRNLEDRIAALEAAVEDLKYWRAFHDREE